MVAPGPVSRCVVVTPTFDSETYLDETIASVVMQVAPAVSLDYHIQDGGSRDRTAAIVAAWIERIEKRLIPIQLHSLRLSFESVADHGMYDALNRGFVHLAPQPHDLVTWINSDDRLAPGAIATVHRVWADNPGCDFVSGRTALINADGALVSINSPQAYPRATLAAGLHDGRTLPFIMQEGTFFSGALWQKVGGVQSSFRLAGDWDLWRRMAREAVHFSVDTITAFHRRRPGQLSSDIALYHAEVDALEPEVAAALGGLDSEAQLIRYDPDGDRWIKAPFDPFAPRPPIAILDGRRRATLAVTYARGFGAPEGPYPEFRLPAGVRWLKEDWAEIGVHAPDEGLVRIRLVLRPTEPDMLIRVHLNGMEIFVARLGDPVSDTDQLVEFSGWLSIGRNTLDFELPPGEAGQRRLLVASATIIFEPDQGDANPEDRSLVAPDLARAVRGMAVVVEAGESATAAVESLASVREIAGTALFVRADPDTDAGAAALAFAPFAELSDPAEAPAARLGAAGYTSVLTVAAGDRVDRPAVTRAHELLALQDAGSVVGLTDVVSSGGVTHRRLLPRIAGGTRLSLVGEDGSRLAPAVAPFPLASRTAERVDDEEARPPTIWVLDDAPAWEISPLYALAGALRMLGVDARHVCLGEGTPPPSYRPLESHLTVTASGRADEGCLLIAETAGDQMILGRGAGLDPVTLPLGIDIDTFRPRGRAAARARLGLDPTEPLVIVDADDAPALGPALAQISGKAIATLMLRRADPTETEPLSLRWPDDPEILSHILSAADAVLVPGPACGPLGRAACACGIPVFDSRGSILTPEGPGTPPARGLPAALRRIAANRPLARGIGARGREAMIRSGSVEAVAVALQSTASTLPKPLADWLSGRHWLAAGDVEVPTSAGSVLAGASLAHHRHFALRILSGASAEADPLWGGTIVLHSATVVLLLRTGKAPGATLRLHLEGPNGAMWSARVDGGPPLSFGMGSEPVTTVRLEAALGPGLHRIELAAANPRAQQHIGKTRILAWEVVADRSPPEPETTKTRLMPSPLAGRQAATLSRDGDWHPFQDFLGTEGPHPPGGLFATFRWTTGRTAMIVLRVERGGPREIDIALTGMISDQRLRIIVGNAVSAWSTPLNAYVGRVSHRRWVMDWPEGDVPVTLELDAPESVPNPRQLGALILGVRLR